MGRAWTVPWVGWLIGVTPAMAAGEAPVDRMARAFLTAVAEGDTDTTQALCADPFPHMPAGGCAAGVARFGGPGVMVVVGRVVRDGDGALVRFDLSDQGGLSQVWWVASLQGKRWGFVDALAPGVDPRTLWPTWAPATPPKELSDGPLGAWPTAVASASMNRILSTCTQGFIDERPGCRGWAARAVREQMSFVPRQARVEGLRAIVLYDLTVGSAVVGQQYGLLAHEAGRWSLAGLTPEGASAVAYVTTGALPGAASDLP